MNIVNTLIPYAELNNNGIQYNVCVDYNHISRYRCVRQVLHSLDDIENRFVTHETTNAISSDIEVIYHTVTAVEENRLDLIAYNLLGNSTYAWIIAYLNNIEDGFTVLEGDRIKVPKNIYQLFQHHEVLAPVPPSMLNLGTE